MREDEILKYENQRRLGVAWAKAAAFSVFCICTASALTCPAEKYQAGYEDGRDDADKSCRGMVTKMAIVNGGEE